MRSLSTGLLVALLAIGTALGHAKLLESTPGSGAEIATPPGLTTVTGP